MLHNFKKFVGALVIGAVILSSCSQDETAKVDEYAVDDVIIQKIKSLGFDVVNNAPTVFEDGYLVEGDIYLTDKDIAEMAQPNFLPNAEHYSTNNLVCGAREITVYAPTGRKGYSAAMIAGLDEAIRRYNAEGLLITFRRVTSSGGADITMTRLSKRDERRGVLGSAGFPSNCDPYNNIRMSGILESSYGLSTDGIATIIAHEMGHCIGFRHTDYFDRSISCGGSTANEGDGGIGANHIPGTPTNATAAKRSWMLACTDGSDRPFNADDRTALDYLY